MYVIRDVNILIYSLDVLHTRSLASSMCEWDIIIVIGVIELLLTQVAEKASCDTCTFNLEVQLPVTFKWASTAPYVSNLDGTMTNPRNYTAESYF